MSDHEKHQIDLNSGTSDSSTSPNSGNTASNINENSASINPPLLGYMQPKSKNNVILVGIACTVLVLLLGIAGYYIYGYFKNANKPKSSLFNSPASVEVKTEDTLTNAPIIDDKPLENNAMGTGTILNPGYLSPEAGDYDGILVSPEEIKKFNEAKVTTNNNLKGGTLISGSTEKTPVAETSPTPSKPQEKPITTSSEPKSIVVKPEDTYGIDWKANDYQKGDITGSSHIVIKGDTLWEISEGKYGEGKEWMKIKNANSTVVGTLRNGNPLIIPGQNLSLPN